MYSVLPSFPSEACYGDLVLLRDVAVPGGMTGYPWLTYVAFAELARVRALGPFAVT